MAVKTTWLLERTAFDDKNPDRIEAAAKSRGHDVIWCNYVPFEGGLIEWGRLYRKIDAPTDRPVIWYGSINGGRWLQRNSQAAPGLWADFEGALRCRSYYSRWGEFLVHANSYVMMPLAEVKRCRRWLYDTIGYQRRLFIRPDDNAKSFAGEVVAEENFDKFYKDAGFYEDDETRLCVVARPRAIFAEWRLVVCDGKVVAGSLYKRDGEPVQEEGFPTEAAEFAERVAAKGPSPAPVYCLDIAQTGSYVGEFDYSLVEIGAVNTAGLYEMNIDPVVEACARVAEREYRELYVL